MKANTDWGLVQSMKNMQSNEPTVDEIEEQMHKTGASFYTARETLRQLAYGPVPTGYTSWGDYWKSY